MKTNIELLPAVRARAAMGGWLLAALVPYALSGAAYAQSAGAGSDEGGQVGSDRHRHGGRPRYNRAGGGPIHRHAQTSSSR